MLFGSQEHPPGESDEIPSFSKKFNSQRTVTLSPLLKTKKRNNLLPAARNAARSREKQTWPDEWKENEFW